MKTKIIVWLIVVLFFTSCDPLADESIIIRNNSQMPVKIAVKKKGNFTDTIKCIYPFECSIQRTFVGDSLLILNCNIEAGEDFILTRSQLIGEVQNTTKEIWMSYLKEISDTIHVIDQSMKKSFYDIENWNVSVDKYRQGGGVSQFSFSIENEDFE